MNKTPSKRGRPRKIAIVQTDDELRTFKQAPDALVNELKRVVIQNNWLHSDKEALQAKIDSLNNSIIGYKAVISYLEYQFNSVLEKK
jgi:hypothetical protein